MTVPVMASIDSLGLAGQSDLNAIASPIKSGIDKQLPRASFMHIVTDFGAKGDGVTDDTESIQRAINESLIASGILLFPHGVYRISKTIIISGYLNIQGLHHRHCKIINYGKGDAVSIISNDSDRVAREISISDITITSAKNSGAYGLSVYNPGRLVLNNVVVVRNPAGGVLLKRNPDFNFMVSFYDCWFNENNGFGVDVMYGNSINFYNCSWQNNVGELRIDGAYINVFGGYFGGTRNKPGAAVEVSGSEASPGQRGGGFWGCGFENNGLAKAHVSIGSANTVNSYVIDACHFINPTERAGNVACIALYNYKGLRISNCFMHKGKDYDGKVTGISIARGVSEGLVIMSPVFSGIDIPINNIYSIEYKQI